VGAWNFSLTHHVQADSGAHQASYQGTEGSFPGGKAAGVWAVLHIGTGKASIMAITKKLEYVKL